MNTINKPDFIFETSWEVCNKVGGIYTVITTKLPALQEKIGDNIVYIGPDFGEGYEPSDFIQDDEIFEDWKEYATEHGLKIRIGRWNIKGTPRVILVDFSFFKTQKDEILTRLWQNYGVDSLTGEGIYIDAVLFGYAIGRVIDSFIDFYSLHTKKVIAHFHEWMSGAGLLYLKNHYTSVATVFTTHATSLGRSICSNGKELYSYLDNQPNQPDVKAKELNIISQHSLEKIIAHNADCFTTVSNLTAKECKVLLKKEPDCITLNGYDAKTEKEVNQKRGKARGILEKVAEALTGKSHKDSFFVVTSGRYEFRNKGVDVFIDSLARLRSEKIQREVVAFVLIPAQNRGVNIALQKKIYGEDAIISDNICTHSLVNPQYDPIIRAMKHHGLNNETNENVKIIFAPVYLNGSDGIFNMPYYDLLSGFDMSVFASYYEPWGYTPQESVGVGIPTVTTTLAGFGIWSKDEIAKSGFERVISIVNRTEDNYLEAVLDISNTMKEYATISSESYVEIQKNTLEFAKKFSWEKFLVQYEQAYDIAIRKMVLDKTEKEQQLKINNEMQTDNINWKKLFVQSNLPNSLKRLEEISLNLWWSWNDEAQDLFSSIDEKAWIESEKNPILLLRGIGQDRLIELAGNQEYLKKLDGVYTDFKAYMGLKPEPDAEHIAYFSMEYGITNILKIYSGGLGILAGDYLKEASDSNIPMVAVGFMYKHGYFKQQLSTEGTQIAVYDTQVFGELPIQLLRGENNEPKIISLQFPGRKVYFRVWKAQVGRVDLYLLDTTTVENIEEDRFISHALYGGDWENRIKQEIILGMGGVRLLKSINVNINICHLNEGHAAFANLERLMHYVDEKLSFKEALEIVRASSLFTTHTPVPAGHDAFTEDFIKNYLYDVPSKLRISWDEFLGLGRFNPENHREKFSMSVFAAKTSQETNGVSKLHGAVSRKMFNGLWAGYGYNELALGYVTNGVHYTTWAAHEWKELHKKYLDKSYIDNLSDKKLWKNIYNVPDREIWATRCLLRKRLINYIRERIFDNWVKRNEDPRVLVDIRENISEEVLTIGFARRFATYKRAHLLFSDLERLAKLLNNPKKPVQLLFAGKAHPADHAGQDSMRRIIEISRMPQFAGKVLFLENYNINLAKQLISGVDVWMNTPTRPLEASGTSGQKAAMNGVLNFSVLDGWWVEGYKEGAGWALPEERTYDDQSMQDKLDATLIYYTLENEVIPMFYDRDSDGLPKEWITYIKNNFAKVAPEFTTKRMIDDYNNIFYQKLHCRAKELKSDDYKKARELVVWKDRMSENWAKISVVKVDFPNTLLTPYIAGEFFSGTLVLDMKDLKDEELIVEMVFSHHNGNNEMEIIEVKPLEVDKRENTLVYFKTTFKIDNPGLYDYGIRITPKNPNLPHRQDFMCMSWV